MRRTMTLILALASAWAAAAPTFLHPDRVRYDGQCFTLNGKDVFLYSGAFHYFRCPKALWRDRFRRIRNAGFNAVETYVAWNMAERNPPKHLNDFGQVDLKDLDDWLTMAEKEFGLYTIVRPGPYICSEWASGGYPQWLLKYKPANPSSPNGWFRSDDPVYLAWSRHWYQAVCKVVAKHQVYKQPAGKPGVILFQIENEYDFADFPDSVKTTQLKSLYRDARDFGIEVPIFTCWTHQTRGSSDPVLGQVFDNPNEYPRWDIDAPVEGMDRQHSAQPWAPRMVTEFQGGWFGGVGGQMAEEQDGIDDKQIGALTLNAIAGGAGGLNYYMLFGGTNFGDWAAQGITTSYDYMAPVREWGGGGPKYDQVYAIGHMLKQYGPEFVRSKPVEGVATTQADGVKVTLRETSNGVRYLFIRNTSRTSPANGTVQVQDHSIDFTLAPFQIKVVRMQGGQTEWLPKLPDPEKIVPATILPIASATAQRLAPVDWRNAPRDSNVQSLGIYDARFVAYKWNAPGKTVQARSKAADLSAWVDDKAIETVATTRGSASFKADGPTVALSVNPGWANGGLGMEEHRGIDSLNEVRKPAKEIELRDWQTKKLDAPSNPTAATPDTLGDSGWAAAENTDVPSYSWAAFRTTFPAQSETFHLVIDAIDDEGWVYVNGKKVGETHKWDEFLNLDPGDLSAHENSVVIVVHNVAGGGGINGTPRLVSGAPDQETGPRVPLLWTDRFEPTDQAVDYKLDSDNLPRIRKQRDTAAAAGTLGPLVRSTLHFDVPNLKSSAWEMVLNAGGDGFIGLNGHLLGRYWTVGPQRAFYLPECWLKPKGNILTLTVRPNAAGDRIKGAALRSLPK
jgi:glycosyl hydrolase family 35/beta-galactosidase-like protein